MVSLCLRSDALLQHLPSYLGFSYLGHGVSLHGCSSKAQPLLLTLDEGYLLTSPITSWQIDGEAMATVRDFIVLGSKITAYGDYHHEIKRRLLLGRKLMTNPDSILKSRDTTLPTKVHLVKAIVFPAVMCGCESWTVKKAQH